MKAFNMWRNKLLGAVACNSGTLRRIEVKLDNLLRSAADVPNDIRVLQKGVNDIKVSLALDKTPEMPSSITRMNINALIGQLSGLLDKWERTREGSEYAASMMARVKIDLADLVQWVQSLEGHNG